MLKPRSLSRSFPGRASRHPGRDTGRPAGAPERREAGIALLGDAGHGALADPLQFKRLHALVDRPGTDAIAGSFRDPWPQRWFAALSRCQDPGDVAALTQLGAGQRPGRAPPPAGPMPIPGRGANGGAVPPRGPHALYDLRFHPRLHAPLELGRKPSEAAPILRTTRLATTKHAMVGEDSHVREMAPNPCIARPVTDVGWRAFR